MYRFSMVVLFAAVPVFGADPDWDETSARRTLEWLANWEPKDTGNIAKDGGTAAEQKKKHQQSLIGRKVKWEVVVDTVNRNGTVTFLALHFPQMDAEALKEWRDPDADDIRDAARMTLYSSKNTKGAWHTVFGTNDQEWARSLERGSVVLLTGTVSGTHDFQRREQAIKLSEAKSTAKRKIKRLYEFDIVVNGTVSKVK